MRTHFGLAKPLKGKRPPTAKKRYFEYNATEGDEYVNSGSCIVRTVEAEEEVFSSSGTLNLRKESMGSISEQKRLEERPLANRTLRPKIQGTEGSVNGSLTERSRNGAPRGKSNNAGRTIGAGVPVASVPVGGGGYGGGVAKFKIKAGAGRGAGAGAGPTNVMGAVSRAYGASGYDVLSSEVNEGGSSSSA